MRDYTDYLIEAILQDLDESAKTDFLDKFGQDTFNNFEKAKQRFMNKGISVDYTKYLKMDKQEVDNLILSVYDDKKDAAKKRAIAGETRTVRGKYNFFGEINGYLVYQPLDYIASMDLGINTGWCTTGRYNHAGHPDFTPSKEDAKNHFNEYTKKGIKLYYFLNPDTFYGEYALALYPDTLQTNTKVYDKKEDKVYELTTTNYELFNSDDDNIWYDTEIIDICRNNLKLDIVADIKETNIKVVNGLEIKNDIKNDFVLKYYGNERNVVVPDNIVFINTDAFKFCTSITNITLPSSLAYIGPYAFAGCTNLQSIEIPDGVITIGSEAFSGCTSLKTVKLPNSVANIGTEAFYGCSGLTSIELPNSIENIPAGLFKYCRNLTSVTLGNNVTSIEEQAFCNCDSLINLTIPDSVTSIGVSAFISCKALTSIVIPDSIKSIGGYAFKGCSGLTSITLPNTITSIERSTFEGCTSLKSITIPDSVTSIGDSVFYHCISLTKIIIPNSVTKIGSYSFSYCTSLTDITIPDSVKSINGGAFSNCTSLRSVTIPANLTRLAKGTFYNCNCYFLYNGDNTEVINELLNYGDIIDKETGEVLYMKGQTVF